MVVSQLETSLGGNVTEYKTISTEHGASAEETSGNPTEHLSLTRRRFVVLLACLTILLEGINLSMPGPFFPEEATKKGLTQSNIGMVIGCFDIANLVFSFVVASIMTPENIKFFFQSGTLWSAITVASFGCIAEGPDGNMFLIAGLVTRIVNGIGASMLYSTAMPIAASMFPDKAGVVTTMIQLFMGMGLVLGPPLGSLLLPYGGYKTPFLFVGCVELVLFILGMIFVPSRGAKTKKKIKVSDYCKFIFRPSTICVLIPNMALYSISGFRDAAYSLYYEQTLGISAEVVGYAFVAFSISYCLSGPVIGVLVELGLGTFCAAAAHITACMFMFLLYIPKLIPELETFALALAVLFTNGITVALVMNPTYLILEKEAIKQGYTNMQQIKTMVASAFNLVMSTGRAFGSFVIGGFITEKLGFYDTTLVFSILLAVTGLWHFIYLIACGLMRRVYYDNALQLQSLKLKDLESVAIAEEDRVQHERTITDLYISSVLRSVTIATH